MATATISVLLFVLSLYVFRKTTRSFPVAAGFFLLAYACLFLYSFYLFADYFSGKGIDEVTLYHLRYGFAGAGYLEYSGILTTTLLLLAGGFVFLLWLASSREHYVKKYRHGSILLFVLLASALVLNPATTDLYRLYQKNPQYADSKATINPDFYKYFREPYIREAGAKQKNIVFIYAESLERTYFKEDVFPGLIRELRDLQNSSTYFTNIRQLPGTGWTVAGMIASMCGIPLVTPSHGNSMSGMDQFLSSAVCLGDLLKDQGYYLAFLGGANTEFAGKDKLLSSHGFDEVAGRKELINEISNPDYHSQWGLFDDSLFGLVYERFLELSRSGNNFGLFTLTLDTHHPAGHPSASCSRKYRDGSNPVLNAVACSDNLVSGFIKKIINSPHARDTVIVLVSDHLAMRNTASDLLRSQERRNLFMIIEPGGNHSQEIDKTGSMLDIAPTLLSYIGFSGEIGLGRDLLDGSADTDSERRYIHDNLGNWRDRLAGFWNFPRIRDHLEVKLDAGAVLIDNRRFRFPVLIRLNEQLDTTFNFEFNKSSIHKTLIEQRRALGEDDYFILVDDCRNARRLDKLLDKRGTCLLAGQGRTYTRIERLDDNVIFSANELRQLLEMPDGFMVHRVAHAGGGIHNETYTNSIDALDHNVRKGFRYFEIDLLFTRDGKLVCLHDWKHGFRELFGHEPKERLTLEEFHTMVASRAKYRICTIDSLGEWMMKNPHAYIVTDVKDNNIKALKTILEILPDAKERVIPQVYHPDNFRKIKNLGYKQLIWTLYRFNGSDDEVLKLAENFEPPFAITIPASKAQSTLPARLREKNIPTYVHTVNSPKEADQFLEKYSVSEIYTDFLPP